VLPNEYCRVRGPQGTRGYALGSHPQSILLQQRQDSEGRHYWSVVDDQGFNSVLNNFSRCCVKLVVRDSIHMQRSTKRDLGNQYTVPGNTYRGSAKVVDHSKLQARLAKPKPLESLKESKGRFVFIQARQLYTRWINHTDIVMVNTKVCAKRHECKSESHPPKRSSRW
jgi:hypothetical protein